MLCRRSTVGLDLPLISVGRLPAAPLYINLSLLILNATLNNHVLD